MQKIIAVIISLLTFNTAYPQWTQSGFLNGRQVNIFERSGSYIFAGTALNGVYRSFNNGDDWVPFNNGISSSVISGIKAINYTTYLSAFGGGVFKSDSGNFFQSINGNLTYFGVDVLTVKDDMLFACMDNNTIYKSTNGGNIWFRSDSGINNAKFSSSCIFNENIFLGTTNTGIYHSTDNGNFWFQSNNGLGNSNIRVLKTDGNIIYCGTQNGLYISGDSGNNWTLIQTNFLNNDIRALEVSGNYIFAGTNGAGIYKSSNNGQNWITINEGLYIFYINTIFKDTDYLFAGAGLGGALRRPLSQIISVKKISAEVPIKCELEQNYPNPFNQSSMFNVKCSISGNVRVILYDMNGREILTLFNENLQAGIYSVKFDAGDLPSGVYFYSMIVEGGKNFSQVNKMIILR